mgnify:CR=1 FL=1
MYVDCCVFRDGIHYPGQFCPHNRIEDETGIVYPTGWTCQLEDWG